MSNEIRNQDPVTSKAAQRDPQLLINSGIRFQLIVFNLIAVFFIVNTLIRQDIRFLILAFSLSLTSLLGWMALTNVWKAKEWIKFLLFIFFYSISLMLLSSVYVSFQGAPFALICLTTAFLFSAKFPRTNVSDWLISIGLLGAIGSIQLQSLGVFSQIYDPRLAAAIGVASLFSLLILIRQFFNGTIIVTLRTKLILAALALTLIPLVLLSFVNIRNLRNEVQSKSNQSLLAAAKQTSQAIDDFLATSLDSLTNESNLPTVVNYLKVDPDLRTNSTEEKELLTTLNSLVIKQKIYQPSYSIINLNGQNILDTEETQIGEEINYTGYFYNVQNSGISFLSPVEFSRTSKEGYLFLISPVKDENARTIGYIRAKYNARILQSIIENYTGLTGRYSFPVLLDENGLRLGDSFAPNLVFRSVKPITLLDYTLLTNASRIPLDLSIQDITAEQPGFFAAIENSTQNPYFEPEIEIQGKKVLHSGAIAQLKNQNWSVIYLQDQVDLNATINSQTRLASILATLVAVFVGLAVTLAAGFFSRPILNITDAAEKVSQGDLTSRAKVTSSDEIGVLGNAFNSMTNQIKGLVDSLESRVRERTEQLAIQNESLQFRSRQLQTIADVARSIVSTKDLETLLSSVSSLVSERFGFYHCGIFLLDPSSEFAVLKAANSKGGEKMLARQHRLRVGQVGIVGYVTSTGNPRIATDVGEDAQFFNNPDLPETKSEMALPLKLENQIIGALDVQSTESNAFTLEDVELFTTLSDQIAIAINNSQLFEKTSAALEESQNLYRQYIRQEWTRQNLSTEVSGYMYSSSGIQPIIDQSPEISMVLDSARPILRTQDSPTRPGETDSILAIPIILNGEPIGAITLQETSDRKYVWSESEIEVAQSVAEQVAQTLENARLFEQTIRRADRERKVMEITGKLRSVTDPQEMLNIAIEELKRNLGVSQAQIVLNVPQQISTSKS